MTIDTTTATEATETTDPAADTQTAPEVTGDPTGAQDDGTGDTDEITKPGNEAAKYRRQLRETETKLTTATERLAVLQRGEVERLASAHLAAGDAFWLAGNELDAVLDEAGNVDPAKVTVACETAISTRPYLAPRVAFASEVGLGSSGTAAPAKASLAALFK